jgi:hypothetical protein
MYRLSQPANRSEAALYWRAVSLIVCEGLPLKDAADRLQVDEQHLRSILEKREAVCSQDSSDELWQ